MNDDRCKQVTFSSLAYRELKNTLSPQLLFVKIKRDIFDLFCPKLKVGSKI